MKKIYFHPTKRVTVCAMKKFPTVFNKLLKAHLNSAASAAALPQQKMRTLTERSFDGLSTCHENDTFDERFGRDLASLRADRVYHRAMRSDLNKVLAQLEKEYLEVFRMLNHENATLIKTEKLIRKMLEENASGVRPKHRE